MTNPGYHYIRLLFAHEIRAAGTAKTSQVKLHWRCDLVFLPCAFCGNLPSYLRMQRRELLALAGTALASRRIVWSAPAAPGRIFNIHDYGAAGDGKARDTTAIQRTVDACALAGGGGALALSCTRGGSLLLLAALHFAGGGSTLREDAGARASCSGADGVAGRPDSVQPGERLGAVAVTVPIRPRHRIMPGAPAETRRPPRRPDPPPGFPFWLRLWAPAGRELGPGLANRSRHQEPDSLSQPGSCANGAGECHGHNKRRQGGSSSHLPVRPSLPALVKPVETPGPAYAEIILETTLLGDAQSVGRRLSRLIGCAAAAAALP